VWEQKERTRKVKINLDFNGIPTLYRVLDRKREMEFQFPGQTVRELAASLVRKFGAPMKDALLDNSGDIDMEIRVVLNDRDYLTEGRMDAALNEGDTVAFVMGG
jgi:hypothetical protein